MKILVITGVMVMGTAVFPTQVTGTGKNQKESPTIIDIEDKLAKELIASKQAKKAPSGAKVNFEVKPLEKEDDDLDSFFGEEDDTEEE